MTTAQNFNAQNVNTDCKCGNTSQNFHNARRAKDDEFYTPFNVVADELDQYYSQLYGKTIYCPCDDPRWSNFVKYFINNRDKLNNTVYASCYYKADGVNLTQVTVIAAKRGNPAGVLDRPDYRRPRTETEAAIKTKMKENGIEVGRDTQITILEKADQLQSNRRAYLPNFNLNEVTNKGDFERTTTTDLLFAACDVIVTNPPFSKWRSFFDTVIASGKKFLILGNTTAASVSNVFAAIKAGKVWAGNSGQIENCYFERPNGAPARKVPVIWYTNLVKSPRAPFVPKNQLTVADLKARGLWETFNERPDVLNVNFVHNIPVDYYGLIAVGAHAFYRFQDGGWEFVEGNHFCDKKIGDRETPPRIVIRRKQNAAAAIEAETQRRIVETAPVIPADDPRGYVYILSDEHDRIKIGVTKNMIEQRVNDLQTGNADELTVSYLSNPVADYMKIEAAAHELFSTSHIRGEWFDGKIFKKAVEFLTHETAPSKQNAKRFGR